MKLGISCGAVLKKYGFERGFAICREVFAYTNHTVMAEALEKWNVDIFKMTLPRIYQIVIELDRRCRAELELAFPGDQGKIDYTAPETGMVGDMDSDGDKDTNDAVYLLLRVMFGETDYPVPMGAKLDVDGSGTVDTNDAVYLLLHVMFGAKDYPL